MPLCRPSPSSIPLWGGQLWQLFVVCIWGGRGEQGEAHSSFGPSSFMQPPPGHFLLPFPPTMDEKKPPMQHWRREEEFATVWSMAFLGKVARWSVAFLKSGFITVLVGEFLSSLVCGDFNTAIPLSEQRIERGGRGILVNKSFARSPKTWPNGSSIGGGAERAAHGITLFLSFRIRIFFSKLPTFLVSLRSFCVDGKKGVRSWENRSGVREVRNRGV